MELRQPPSYTARPWRYLAWAVGASWLFYALAIWWGEPEPHPVTLAFHYLGGLAVPAVAVVMLFRLHDREFRRDYWLRVVDGRRIGIRWWLVILGLAPVLTLLAGACDSLIGGAGLTWETARFAAQPTSVIPFALFILVFGPIPEELGWRGYALDGLQARTGALGASLVLGAVWGLWHFPLYFIEGSYQGGRQEAVYVILQVVNCMAESVIITWVYNQTRLSTLSAILIHFMVNFVGELTELSRAGEVWRAGWWIAVAIWVVWVWGPRTLGGRERRPIPTD